MYGGAIISEFIPEPTSRRLTVGFLWPDLKRSSGKQSRRQAKSEVIDVVDDEFEDEFQYFKDESDVEDDFDDEVEVEVKPFAFSAAEPRYSNGNVFRPRPPRGPVDPVRCVPKLARLTELNESTGNSEILPIFFDVTPSDVKVKTKLYVEDLDKHEQWPVGESWERWEAALRKVGKSKGWEVQGKAHVEAIELALKEVLHKLSRNKRLLDGKLESREVGRTSGVDDRSARRRISSWQKGEMLGRGSFGDVYKAFTDDGSFLAVKEVSLLDQRSQGKESLLHIEQEISILSQLQHENIVQYHGTKKGY